MTRKQRRLTMIGCALAVLAFAAGLVLYALRDSIVFFSTPSMAAEQHIAPGKRFRLGGLVQPGSLVCGGSQVSFEVADGGDIVLAKHDENYMPKDVADALKKQGHWKDDYGKQLAENIKGASCAHGG